MTDVNYMAVAFYTATLLICLTCIIYTYIQNRTDTKQKKFFLAMMFMLMLNTFTEAIIETATPHVFENPVLPTLIEICKFVYFLVHTMMLPMMGYYVLIITGGLYRFTPLRHIIFEAPIVVLASLMLTNPIHHQCYYFDPVTFEYHRGWGVTVLYIVSAFYIAYFVSILFFSWRAITAKRRAALGYFMFVVIAGIVIQLVLPHVRVELFAESFAFLGLLLTVEDEGELIDTDVGIYNRKALRIDVDNLLANRQKLSAICVRIDNSDVIRRVTGSANIDILTDMMYAEFIKYVHRYEIYQTSPDTFVLLLNMKNKKDPRYIVDQLGARFEKSFKYQNVDVMLIATIMLAALPGDIDNSEEVFGMADCALPRNHKKCLIGKEDLGYLLRRRAVEEAIQTGLSNGGFEVYYQPTVKARDFTIHGAEALVRLNDEKLGQLMPGEFIPLTEQLGLIGEVDDYVLKTVCEFIASGVPGGLGMQSINVNLSVLQCVKPGFVDHLIKIVDDVGVDHSKINFEITESVDANDYAAMKSVISRFRDSGFRIYMDDYGTGYSNVQALFSMDFNVVKIDKSILWAAEKDRLGMILLENNIRMLRQMELEILVEGVETKEQTDLLMNLGVDYFQGFFFARPVPKDELVSILNNR